MQDCKNPELGIEDLMDFYIQNHLELTIEEVIEKFLPVPPEINELLLAYEDALAKNKVYSPGITDEQRIDRIFGTRMSICRNNMNLTQKDLAAALGRIVSAIKKN